MIKVTAINCLLYLILLAAGCGQRDSSVSAEESNELANVKRVTVIGYDGNMMEPFLSRDGKILFFNNLNAPPENTNIHWATRIDDLTFQYKGEVAGINSPVLDGVPSMDRANNLYFLSTRTYFENFSTIYRAKFSDGKVENVTLLKGLSKGAAPWVTFDVEGSADGETLYLSEGKFGNNGIPQTADIFAARRNNENFERLPDSDKIFKNINTDDLEYAAAISEDELELYFTRATLPVTLNTKPQIYYSKRKDKHSAFESPTKLAGAEGFVEAISFSPQKGVLYFHKKINEKHYLYCIKLGKGN